jgi:hypothetical protein
MWKQRYRLEAQVRDRVVVEGSFDLNNTSPTTAPSSPKGYQGLWAVTKSATGTYVVALTDSYPDLESVICSLGQATNASNVFTCHGGPFVTTVGAQTVTFYTINGSSGALADPTTASTTRLHFILTFRGTDVPPNG